MYNLSLPMLFKKSLMMVSISYFSFSKSILRIGYNRFINFCTKNHCCQVSDS